VTKDAPAAIGPYSQGIQAGGFLFLSGQVALDPATGQLMGGDIRAQTERVLKNLEAVLAAAGSSMAAVVKTTVYLADMNDFAAMNEVYARFFPAPPPARSTVQAARLPRDARVEIDVIAVEGK
jgi:2-iminobutanoate/2-iminopropanoate deaminase